MVGTYTMIYPIAGRGDAQPSDFFSLFCLLIRALTVPVKTGSANKTLGASTGSVQDAKLSLLPLHARVPRSQTPPRRRSKEARHSTGSGCSSWRVPSFLRCMTVKLGALDIICLDRGTRDRAGLHQGRSQILAASSNPRTSGIIG